MEELAHVGREDPTADPRRHAESTPISISDFVSARTFARTRIYAHVCEPLGVADSLRLYLPPSHASVRFFFLDSSRRGFSQRTRLFLETLRPHLHAARERWTPLEANPIGGVLTPREAEIMRHVEASATNEGFGFAQVSVIPSQFAWPGSRR
jgi:hypothetical protein